MVDIPGTDWDDRIVRKGKQIGRETARTVDRGVDQVRRTVDETADDVGDTVDRGVDRVSQRVDQAADDVSDTVDDAVDEARRRVTDEGEKERKRQSGGSSGKKQQDTQRQKNSTQKSPGKRNRQRQRDRTVSKSTHTPGQMRRVNDYGPQGPVPQEQRPVDKAQQSEQSDRDHDRGDYEIGMGRNPKYDRLEEKARPEAREFSRMAEAKAEGFADRVFGENPRGVKRPAKRYTQAAAQSTIELGNAPGMVLSAKEATEEVRYVANDPRHRAAVREYDRRVREGSMSPKYDPATGQPVTPSAGAQRAVDRYEGKSRAAEVSEEYSRAVESGVEYAKENPAAAAGYATPTAAMVLAGGGGQALSRGARKAAGSRVVQAPVSGTKRVARDIARADDSAQMTAGQGMFKKKAGGSADKPDVEGIQVESLGDLDDATQQALKNTETGQRNRAARERARVRFREKQEELRKQGPDEPYTQDPPEGYTAPKPEGRTVSRGPDTSRSGPTAAQQRAFRSRGTSKSSADLSPRENQLAAKLGRQTPTADWRTVHTPDPFVRATSGSSRGAYAAPVAGARERYDAAQRPSWNQEQRTGQQEDVEFQFGFDDAVGVGAVGATRVGQPSVQVPGATVSPVQTPEVTAGQDTPFDDRSGVRSPTDIATTPRSDAGVTSKPWQTTRTDQRQRLRVIQTPKQRMDTPTRVPPPTQDPTPVPTNPTRGPPTDPTNTPTNYPPPFRPPPERRPRRPRRPELPEFDDPQPSYDPQTPNPYTEQRKNPIATPATVLGLTAFADDDKKKKKGKKKRKKGSLPDFDFPTFDPSGDWP